MPTALLIVLMGAAIPFAATDNACTNGSFEELAPSGFPADWGPVGQTVEVSNDAHTGQHSIRMMRDRDTASPETGINRGWHPHHGKQGAMLSHVKGGIDFWYKGISGKGDHLCFGAIPMDESPFEVTEARRAFFKVPQAHVGDGQWHHGRMKFDYTDHPEVKWVHFSARITGPAGEFLLDDVSYVEQAGPILRIDRVNLVESLEQPGHACTITAQVTNAGDLPAQAVQVSVDAPQGLAAGPARLSLGALEPDDAQTMTLSLEGPRAGLSTVTLTARSAGLESAYPLRLAPQLSLTLFGPSAPVVAEGGDVFLECLIENEGNAIATGVQAAFDFDVLERPDKQGGHRTSVACGDIAPGTTFRAVQSFAAESRQPPGPKAFVRITATNTDAPIEAKTAVALGSATELPAPSGKLHAVATNDCALIENDKVRLAFGRNVWGFGPGEVSVKSAGKWRTVAWLPHLSRIECGEPASVMFEFTAYATRALDSQTDDGVQLRLDWIHPLSMPVDGEPKLVTWSGSATFTLGENDNTLTADYEVSCDAPVPLLAFDGLMLHALERDEAVFPGLEWLVDDEVSSSTLDIAEGHPHQVRYVVHPNMVTIPAIGIHSRRGTVGLLWDVHQQWDGVHDRPSVVFASPDRFENQLTHVAGLMLPSVPEFLDANTRTAAWPYPMQPGKPLRLRCRIFADGEAQDALTAVDEWVRLYGLPDPPPLPHGDYESEIAFSMRAYFESLWLPDTQEWWGSKGGHPIMCPKVRPHGYMADLLTGALLSPDAGIRTRCQEFADEMAALMGGTARLDQQRFAGRFDLAVANPGRVAGPLATVEDDGAWRFDAERIGTGVFEGIDYRELGEHNAVEVGTCARNAFEVLRYARVTGDWQAYDRMQKTLDLMEQFQVPRAAQVWEVPVHTPDVLAAADAVDAYIEAYRFSGEERWLEDAVAWARRGVPFIYLWHDPELPFLVGGSIPVFGATFYQGSWFACPVQWNGLRYANALLKLDEYDDSFPWRPLAELIIRSAIHQQDLDGENVALWPDNVSAIDAKKCPWVFAPRQIIRNMLKLIGYDEDPATWIAGEGRERLHVTAAAAITNGAWEDGTLSFDVAYPKGDQGVVLVSNVTRPASVVVDGEAASERTGIELIDVPCWRYDSAHAYLSVRIPHDGRSSVRIERARFQYVERLPQPVDRIAFEFEDSAEGWTPQHDLGGLAVSEGTLCAETTGVDPYLVRPYIQVNSDDYPVIVIRMRGAAGPVGQFFWMTQASPTFDEEKSLQFPLHGDGAFHEYRLEMAKHPQWAGQRIIGLRIDPGGGALAARVAIDFVREGKRI